MRTEFQKRLLQATSHHAGVSLEGVSAKEKKEAQVLIDEGLIVISKNYSGDNVGMYCKKLTPVELEKKLREYKTDEDVIKKIMDNLK